MAHSSCSTSSRNLAAGHRPDNAQSDIHTSNAPHSVTCCVDAGCSIASFALESPNHPSQLMVPPEFPQALYRFGLFEADSRTGELRKQGRPLKVRGRPFYTLLL